MKTYARIMAISVLVTATGLLTTLGAARADQFETLRTDERLHNGLLAITIGRHIERTCPSIERRDLAANAFLLGLATHAMGLGYSRAEVTAYVEDDTEQDRYITLARRYFAERGVMTEDDVEGACRVGRDEIAAGSPIGRLLRGG
ncbi:DUF5333 domain-containing protein [Roseicyclus persicicus]|uniref:DUF5333 domain-containing protein n=1 Tax=Roseicyclus persicicus TaxID=2650661 RepID=A0A7X6GXQ8_9RHOB|nr:DUF5333 domain-containing protein [Roseibacterium persicicum]NKX44346.1 DUF5333 domain-containing protein [Roseibacterium persicicum]